MGKTIYCPNLKAYMPNSYMGLEWESCGVPGDELLDKHTLLSNALKEDLLYAASKNDDFQNIMAISKCGFSALHNIIYLACPIIREQVLPNVTLLKYSTIQYTTSDHDRRTNK